MTRFNLDTKRQLLADLLAGNAHNLCQYRTNLQLANSPYQWIINDGVVGTVYGIGKDGSQHSFTLDDLTEAPPNIIITIVDFSGGRRIPEPDEDYHQLQGF